MKKLRYPSSPKSKQAIKRLLYAFTLALITINMITGIAQCNQILPPPYTKLIENNENKDLKTRKFSACGVDDSCSKGLWVRDVTDRQTSYSIFIPWRIVTEEIQKMNAQTLRRLTVSVEAYPLYNTEFWIATKVTSWELIHNPAES